MAVDNNKSNHKVDASWIKNGIERNNARTSGSSSSLSLNTSIFSCSSNTPSSSDLRSLADRVSKELKDDAKDESNKKALELCSGISGCLASLGGLVTACKAAFGSSGASGAATGIPKSTSDQITELREERGRYQHELDRLNNSEKLREEMSLITETVSNINVEIASYDKMTEDIDADIKQCKESKGAIEQGKAATEQGVTAADGEIQATDQQTTQVEGQEQSAQDSIKLCQNTLTQLDAEISRAKAHGEDTKALETRRDEIKKQQNNKEALIKQLEGLKEDLKIRRKKAESRKQANLDELKKYVDSEKAIEKAVDNKTKQKEKAQSQKTSAEKAATEASNKKDELELSAKKLEERRKELKEKIEELDKQIKKLEEKQKDEKKAQADEDGKKAGKKDIEDARKKAQAPAQKPQTDIQA